MKSITLALAFCLSSQFSLAADVNGDFLVQGRGDHSCGKIIKANKLVTKKDIVEIGAYLDYLLGYATAYNMKTKNTYDIFMTTDASGVWAYISKYCDENPLDNYLGAIESLLHELHPKRIKKAPAD